MAELATALIILAVILVLALVNYFVVARRRHRGSLSLLFFVLFLIATGEVGRIDARLALPLGVVAIVGALTILLRPKRTEPDGEDGAREETRDLGVLGVIAVISVALVGFSFVYGMFQPAYVYVEGLPLQPLFTADESLSLQLVVVRERDLPRFGEYVGFSVPGALATRPITDPDQLVDCEGCLGLYLVVLRGSEEEQATTWVPRARIKVPHLFAGDVEDSVEFESTTAEAETRTIPIAASFDISLTPDHPFEVVRVSSLIPAEAMTSYSLDEWPAFIEVRVHSQHLRGILSGNLDPSGCSTGAPCPIEVKYLIEPYQAVEIAQVDTMSVTGNVYFTSAPLPPPDTEILYQFETPSRWYHDAAQGEKVLEEPETEPDSTNFMFDFPADGLDEESACLASLRLPDDDLLIGRDRVWCSDDECRVTFETGIRRWGESVAWQLDLDCPLFDDDPEPATTLQEVELEIYPYYWEAY